MTRAESKPDALVLAARRGDHGAFDELVRRHRRELHVHCYRMTGSIHDADDAVQEAFLRAWRGLPGFEGRSSVRSWLYRIATNVCLNLGARRARRALPTDFTAHTDGPALGERLDPSGAEPTWLEPYPDEVVGLPDGYAGPAARYEQRESVELAFVAALQHLPANQRAALLLRDVLGFSAREAAEMLGATPVAVNSALQHARRTVASRVPERSQQATLRDLGDQRLAAIVNDYMAALERGDVKAIVALLAEDSTWSMPPLPMWYRGTDAIATFLAEYPCRQRWRHLLSRANGQLAVGCYLWDSDSSRYISFALDVLTLRGPLITEVTAFLDGGVFGRFGLPASLPIEEFHGG
jgi:RNA polymerase sigma-70 factor (ECF subfamily)